MSKIKVESIVAIDGFVLTVYYSPGKCYQFSIVDEYDCTYDFPNVFYSVKAVEIEARKITNTLSD